jgi:hypothetical protein
MRNHRTALIAAAIALTAVAVWAQQGKSVGEVLEGKIKQAAFHYYLGMVVGDPEEYLKGTRLPLQTVRNGKIGTMDETAARAMLRALAAKQAEKPLTKDERTQVIGNIIRSLDEADIRFIGANTATLVFLVREDQKTKAVQLCSLTLHRPDPKAPEWKVIGETTDSEPVPADYVK